MKVVELFAGVGGFRLGLEASNRFEVVWSNQWEPSTKVQHASSIYEARFGGQCHSNQDIETVATKDIPDHDLLVGGFPCQDYSVATTLSNSGGLSGKKGVLWWSIHRILMEKKNPPNYLMLENVDRLISSPANQKGRDFGIMLKSLNDLGYIVEWRVINAADYGMPQRRKRIFILGYHRKSRIGKSLSQASQRDKWLTESGVIESVFQSESVGLKMKQFTLPKTLQNITVRFGADLAKTPFENSGISCKGRVSTQKVRAVYSGKQGTLGSVLQNGEVTQEFFISEQDLERWKYLKGAKKESRVAQSGYTYFYSEGAMTFPDDLNKPSRTIITGEGGKAPSRFKHIVQSDRGLRRLSPVELERLNMFPDDHTKLEGVSNSKRAFLMGNALVVGVVEKLGRGLIEKIDGL